ncbi:hypothetical protein SAMN02746065_11023 [Desulfocicer vacuolatum DSM 3385]|uniref:Phage ABA sandwich domain-containing protein n=1 Tax=Desulfocicer vacuolatum DSM 3385 TaxID=1121400 RepID=A0A1W2BZB6_9BACT|nr:hypothetical protein [Desulfocicer vacuolatum]SMC78240.1 hypothetical protein SAMN02746065_11023 [Desulfocicer vacuolatum DSM 3385]
MSDSIPEILEKQLKHHLGKAVPANVAHDIHSALQLSEVLEAKGFSFRLKDLCPKSLNETQWSAVFIKDGQEFSANNAESAVAICTAAVGALSGK